MGMISVGPLLLPVLPLLLAVALIAGLLVGKRVAAVRRNEIDLALYNIVFVGLLAARLGFVIRYWDQYRPLPLGALDIRDGGFFPWIGVAAGFGMALWYLSRNRVPRAALLWALTAGIAVAAFGGAAAWMLHASSPEARLPGETFMKLDGSPLRLDTFRGKPVVINLWATWCPPCRREMPVLQQAQAGHREVVFVFADQGETADAVREYLAAQHIDIANVILDSRMDIARQAGSRGLPTTLFFDATGRLLNRRTGQLSAASLAQELAAIPPKRSQ